MFQIFVFDKAIECPSCDIRGKFVLKERESFHFLFEKKDLAKFQIQS